MKANLIVSARGQLTLPSEIRKKYGIDEGSILVAEDRDGEIVLKPAAVLEVEFYSDQQISDWIRNDTYKGKSEQEKVRARLKNAAKKR
jgi:antitoxin PrlF